MNDEDRTLYKFTYDGEELDAIELLGELSLNAHNLKDHLRDKAIYAIEWGTTQEVANLVEARTRLMNGVIGPIERLRIAIKASNK